MRNLAALWNGLLFTIAWPLCTVAAATQQAPLSPAKPVVAPKTAAFKPGQVRLLEGVFRESREAEAKYMLSLDVDRLLVPYRVGVGLPAKAEAYGGWEKRNLPGVGLAFYLSGLVRLAAETGEPEYARRLTYILDEFETCQRDGGGYLLGTSDGRAILSRVEREGYWEGFGKFSTDGRATPYYSMEKLFSGLCDAWRIGHERRALQIEIALANWLEGHMSHLSDPQLQQLMTIEFGGMNCVLADLYADTGDVRYLAMSRRWQHRWLTDDLAKGIDNLADKHANAPIPENCRTRRALSLQRRSSRFGDCPLFLGASCAPPLLCHRWQH